jgi:hypothetical protein
MNDEEERRKAVFRQWELQAVHDEVTMQYAKLCAIEEAVTNIVKKLEQMERDTRPFQWITRFFRKSPHAIAEGASKVSKFSRMVQPILIMILTVIAIFSNKSTREAISSFLEKLP